MNGLEELRQKRLKWIEANRENNFEDGIKRLLTDLYPANAHFIYELLQNAEDTRASTVRFTLTTGAVEFEHDGERLFSRPCKTLPSRMALGFEAHGVATRTPGNDNPGSGFLGVFDVHV